MKKILYILAFVFFVSCTSNTIYQKPKDLIQKDTMVALLTDLYIATSAKNIKNIHKQRPVNYMPLVYTKYKIDSTRFTKSNIYYTSALEDYNEILTEVKSNLQQLQKKFKKEIKVLDSIKNEEKKQRIKENKERFKNEKLKIDSTKIKSLKLPERNRN